MKISDDWVKWKKKNKKKRDRERENDSVELARLKQKSFSHNIFCHMESYYNNGHVLNFFFFCEKKRTLNSTQLSSTQLSIAPTASTHTVNIKNGTRRTRCCKFR